MMDRNFYSQPAGPSSDACWPERYSILVLPLEQVADRYRATDERRAIKTLLRV